MQTGRRNLDSEVTRYVGEMLYSLSLCCTYLTNLLTLQYNKQLEEEIEYLKVRLLFIAMFYKKYWPILLLL